MQSNWSLVGQSSPFIFLSFHYVLFNYGWDLNTIFLFYLIFIIGPVDATLHQKMHANSKSHLKYVTAVLIKLMKSERETKKCHQSYGMILEKKAGYLISHGQNHYSSHFVIFLQYRTPNTLHEFTTLKFKTKTCIHTISTASPIKLTPPTPPSRVLRTVSVWRLVMLGTIYLKYKVPGYAD